MSALAIFPEKLFGLDDLPDPFAAIFGTRRGLPGAARTPYEEALRNGTPDYLSLTYKLGTDGVIAPGELAKHTEFQSILNSAGLWNSDLPAGEGVVRVHLGISFDSQRNGPAHFAVLLAKCSVADPENPLAFANSFETEIWVHDTLDKALTCAATHTDKHPKVRPIPRPALEFEKFTAEMFDAAFKQRLLRARQSTP